VLIVRTEEENKVLLVLECRTSAHRED
jgi:hypothetical protein